MKKLILIGLPSLLFFYMASTSCVPTRKLKSAQGKIDQLKKDSTAIHTHLNECLSNVSNLENEKKSLLNEKTGLVDKNKSIQNDLNNLSTTSKMTIEEQAARLKSLEGLIQAQKDVLNNLKKTISDALINFKADELNVSIKDGNVYVSLEEKLLFKSGSSVVDPKGKQALAKLGEVLKSTSDINIMIEGHTDNVPIKTTKFEDNWSLSTERALAIVRLLTKDYGVDSHRIIASGRGEFYPIKANDSTEGRSSNRRTEIILTPNLTELFKLLGQ